MHVFQRLGAAGFGRAQLQSDALEPFLRQVATVLDDAPVSVENNQISGKGMAP
jgi:hypothetical protein